jgi:hypothetical protein
MISAARRIRLMFFIFGFIGLIQRQIGGKIILIVAIRITLIPWKRYSDYRGKNNRFNKAAMRRRQFPEKTFPSQERTVPERDKPGWRNAVRLARLIYYLTTTHAVTAIQALIAGTAADGDMATGIAGRGIALHAAGGCVDGVQSVFRPGAI